MFILTSAIMHEASHYGRFMNGLPDGDDVTEPGAQFEQNAFDVRFSYRNSHVASIQGNGRDIKVVKGWFQKNKGSTTTFGMSTSPVFTTIIIP